MIKTPFEPGWRPQSKWKRKFYAKYMTWLERGGYTLALLVIVAFIGSFLYRVDETIRAEGVQLKAAVTEVKASEGTIVSVNTPSGTEVKKGDVLFTLRAKGTARIFGFGSPGDGVWKAADDLLNKVILSSEEVVGTIVDYSTLIFDAKLKGDSAPRSALNQIAKISNLTIQESETSTVVRLEGSGGAAYVSRSMVPELNKAIGESLTGKSVRVRQEGAIEIESVEGVQVDARVATSKEGRATNTFDPSPSLNLEGVLASGKHELIAQIANIPAASANQASQSLRLALESGNFSVPDTNESVKVSNLTDPRYIVTVKATRPLGAAPTQTEALEGSLVERSVRGIIQVKNPPKFLVDRLRECDEVGGTITATVEVITGSKPIALVLIKKS